MAAHAPAPIDTSVHIPEAVRAAAARAEEFYKKPESDPPQDAAPSDPAPEPEAAPKDPTPEPSVTPESNADSDQSWEHRYRSMKGRFDRTNEANRVLSERVTDLERMLSTMSAQPAQAPGDASLTPAQRARLLTQEERNEYGEEFLDVVGRRAKEELGSEVSSLKDELARVTAQLNGVSGNIVQDARERMTAALTQKVPNWLKVNDDPNFLQWLSLPDVYSGAIRHGLLSAAWERNDTPRVLAFFQGFLSDEAATDPANGQDDTNGAQPQAAAPNGKVPLESFAAPGRAKTAAAGAPAEKPFFTRAQITQFYVDCAAGKYAGRDADKGRFEASIFEAQREGRIR